MKFAIGADILAERICIHMLKRGQIKENDFDLYVYGFREGMILLVNLFIWLIIGWLFGQFWENVIFVFMYWFLRRYAGGYHADSRGKCFCYSVLLVLANMWAIYAINIPWRAGMVMLSAALLVIWICSPVESVKNNMEEGQRKKFRIMSRIIGIAAWGLAFCLYGFSCEKFAQSMILGICSVSFLQIAALVKRRRQGIFLLGMVLSAAFFSCVKTHAEESLQDKAGEIVVVLDCSKSMEDADRGQMAFDFAKGLSAAALRGYKIGVVGYNDDICISLPLGTSYATLENEMEGLEYMRYGNAGAGLERAVELFGNGETEKHIILISDGEIMMESEEETEDSVELFHRAVQAAKNKNIAIDVLAIGERIEEGDTVYGAAAETGGELCELKTGEELQQLVGKYLLEKWKMNQSHIGKVNGINGVLEIRLPDCLMETAKIVLLGKQQNENLTINCEAEKIDVWKGSCYTVVELQHPISEEVKIQTFADTEMEVDAYLMAEYDFVLSADYAFKEKSGESRNSQKRNGEMEAEIQEAEIYLTISNISGQNLLDGYLGNGGMEIYLDGEKQEYQVLDGKACIKRGYAEDGMAELEVRFPKGYGSYYGERIVKMMITVPAIEEKPEEINWFFWCVIGLFVIVLGAIFYLSYRKGKASRRRRKIIDESREAPRQKGLRGNDFCGKIVVYVIHNKEDIDYPPESINLFARCNREMITLEWILDVCNLPFSLEGAERIVIKPGADRSLIIKNNSKASALMGRELLAKGRSCHLYYHEKITFLFDQEDTEIEIHYKDLKPNER